MTRKKIMVKQKKQLKQDKKLLARNSELLARDRELLAKATCKYCKVFDAEENMHKDTYTEEFYHENCRPKGIGVESTVQTRQQPRSRGRVVSTGRGG